MSSDNEAVTGRFSSTGPNIKHVQKQQDQHSQGPAVEDRLTDVFYGTLDIIGGINNRRHLNLGDVLVDPLDLLEYAPGYLDRVGPGLLIDGHANTWAAVDLNDLCYPLP